MMMTTKTTTKTTTTMTTTTTTTTDQMRGVTMALTTRRKTRPVRRPELPRGAEGGVLGEPEAVVRLAAAAELLEADGWRL